jgi:hypothetical protein
MLKQLAITSFVIKNNKYGQLLIETIISPDVTAVPKITYAFLNIEVFLKLPNTVILKKTIRKNHVCI